MAKRTSKSEREQSRIAQVVKKVRDSEEQTREVRLKWRENYLQFAQGSVFREKEEWQSKVTLGRFESRVRNATASARNILINQPDWFIIEPTNPDDQLSQELAPTFDKILKYYLRRSKFGRMASTFLLCAFISMGSMALTWKKLFIQNPQYLARKRRRQEQEEANEIADMVINPPAGRDLTEEEIAISGERALRNFQKLLTGEAPIQEEVEEEIKPYIAIGVPQIEVINPENRFWDPTVQYISDSPWDAYRTWDRLSNLKHEATRGVYDKKKLEEIDEMAPLPERSREQRQTFGRLADQKDAGLVELLVYFGPMEDDEGKVIHERYGCIIANESVIIKEWEEYPYWEPPGHMPRPFVDAAVKEVPFRATGAGVGDNAVELSRALDSNVNLQIDAARFNLVGFTVVDYNSIVDKSRLEEGIQPGDWIEVRGKAKDAVEHVSLTNNIEVQSFPTNNMLDDAIDENMGTSEISMGGRTQRSRVTASEIEARTRGSEETVSNTSLDLEYGFLVPFLEKLFARVLQFGLKEVESNPELSHLLSDREKELLLQLTAEERADILSQYYNFRVKGFSSRIDKQAKLQSYSEVLSIVNSGGPASQMINMQALLRRMFRLMDINDDASDDIFATTQADYLTLENQLLQEQPNGRPVMIGETDDHQVHLKSHSMIPNPTQAMQQHMQMHQQAMQALQQAQEQAQAMNKAQGAPRPRGPVMQ